MHYRQADLGESKDAFVRSLTADELLVLGFALALRHHEARVAVAQQTTTGGFETGFTARNCCQNAAVANRFQRETSIKQESPTQAKQSPCGDEGEGQHDDDHGGETGRLRLLLLQSRG
jgi:hypothetical protein